MYTKYKLTERHNTNRKTSKLQRIRAQLSHWTTVTSSGENLKLSFSNWYAKIRTVLKKQGDNLHDCLIHPAIRSQVFIVIVQVNANVGRAGALSQKHFCA